MSEIHEIKLRIEKANDILDFLDIKCSEFDNKNFHPEIVRQARRQRPMTHHSFMNMGGEVDFLTQEEITSLFCEIYWHIYAIKKASSKKSKSCKKAREILDKVNKHLHGISEAEEELFLAHRALIMSCTSKFRWLSTAWHDDLLQTGSLALIKAVHRYNPQKGTPFFHYAQRAIINSLINFVKSNVCSDTLLFSASKHLMYAEEAIREWRNRYGRRPSDRELAEAMNIPNEEAKMLKDFVKNFRSKPCIIVSLDEERDNSISLYDIIPDARSQDVLTKLQLEEIFDAIRKLSERNRKILELRFVNGLSGQDVGKLFNMTRAGIQKVEAKAIKQIRKDLGITPLIAV